MSFTFCHTVLLGTILLEATGSQPLHTSQTFTMTVEVTRADRSVSSETFTVPIEGNAATFAYDRGRIPADAVCVTFKPDFAWAVCGEEGYFVMPDGTGSLGRFTRTSGSFVLRRNWFPTTAHGMKTPRRTFLVVPTGMRWSFNPAVVVKDGRYEMSTRFDMDVAHAYENPSVKYIFLEGADADYSGMGRALRRERFTAGEMKSLKERRKTSPELDYAIGTPIIRIRNCWKNFRKHPLPEQNEFDEPPVDVYVTFDRTRTLLKALKAAGLAKADVCLVGWNYRGHDGRYPQVFPVEPLLGGAEKLKELTAFARNELGYQLTGHVNFRDAYLIADCFDFEYCVDRRPDQTRIDISKLEPWSGGAVYRVCPRRAYERFCLKHTAMMKSLGFRGMAYSDVTTSRPLLLCGDERHPCNAREARKWELAMIDVQRAAFGAYESEGGYDWAIGKIDSGLTISYADPFNANGKRNPLVDEVIPFWQIAYHGTVMSSPFRNCWNTSKNPDRWVHLKSVEYGGRPVFYIYGGWDLPERASWDLKCRTDAELDETVRAVLAGMADYNRRAHLEAEFIDRHEKLSEGVYKTTYSSGESTVVNYNTGKWELQN